MPDKKEAVAERLFEQAEVNDSMLGLTPNDELTFVIAPRAAMCREVMEDVIREGPNTNSGDLSVSTQTAFTKRLVQAALRGEMTDSLLQRNMKNGNTYREVTLTSCSD